MMSWDKDEWRKSGVVEEDWQMVEEEGWKYGGIMRWPTENDR